VCDTLSFNLREKKILSVVENMAARKIFGPKRQNLTGGQRKLHNEEGFE
jgi:hypothetical protein